MHLLGIACFIGTQRRNIHPVALFQSSQQMVEWFKSFPKNDSEIWREQDFQTTQLARISTKHVCDCVCETVCVCFVESW